MWEIDKFLKKVWRKNRMGVLVRWQGNNRSEDRWVPVLPGWLNEVALEEAEAMPLENPEAAERFRSRPRCAPQRCSSASSQAAAWAGGNTAVNASQLGADSK